MPYQRLLLAALLILGIQCVKSLDTTPPIERIATHSLSGTGLRPPSKKQPTAEIDESTPSERARAPGPAPPSAPMTMNQILKKAALKGLGGGVPGFLAGVIQVLSLMWLRTIINYQCRYGTSFLEALKTLYKQGGIARLYRGMGFALVQAPLARFVSTASNDGIQAFLKAFPATQNFGPGRIALIGGFVVGLWRIALMPVDTCKTVLQVDSLEGFRHLMRRVKAGQIGVLYQGSLALAVSSMMGHYPWFYTYNLLSTSKLIQGLVPSTILRNASIGVAASVVSDTIVNSIRVVKTMKQAMGSKHQLSYFETVNMILAADGWKGLFGRGLRTRIYANALQSLVFTVIWRGLADYWTIKNRSDAAAPTL